MKQKTEEQVQPAQPTVQEQLDRALKVLDMEHEVIRTMKNAESDRAILRKLSNAIVKPYRDSARVVSGQKRIEAAELDAEIARLEKPTFDRMATDTITVNGEQITVAKRLELVRKQSATVSTTYKDAKERLFAVVAPVAGQ